MVFRWLQFWRRKEEAEVHDHLAEELLKSVIRLERTIDKALNLLIHVIENRESRVTGGRFRQIK